MAKSANGSTVTFNSASIGELTDISFSDGANEIDVTVLADSEHVFETGIPSLECSITIKGNTTLARGATGSLAIAWNDGTSDAMSSAMISNIETSGALDGAIETSITFVPADA